MFDDLLQKVVDGPLLTLETTPEHSASFEPIVQKIKDLDLYKLVDGFTTTDSPLAKMKYNSILASIKLQSSFNKPSIATMSMRDRNKIALQSDLLGANEFDIRAILALTGDSANISDQPNTKGVFEDKSTMLLDIIKFFNAGIDYGGRELSIKPKKIYPFAVTNSYAKNPKTLKRKISSKMNSGAIALMSQPVFDVENAKFLLDLVKEANQETNSNTQLIIGFFPIIRLKTAQFLSAHVPGINVPKIWIDKLYSAKKISDEEERKVGLDLSIQNFKQIYKMHPKMHLMTANRFGVAKEILTTL
jgi:5,10-methylenetetrahydrofolate reductase